MKKSIKIILIIVCVILILVIGIGVFFIVKQKNEVENLQNELQNLQADSSLTENTTNEQSNSIDNSADENKSTDKNITNKNEKNNEKNSTDTEKDNTTDNTTNPKDEIKKCLRDKNWLKQNAYINEDGKVFDDSDITFAVCKSSNDNPVVILDTVSEKALINQVVLVTYKNGEVTSEIINQGHYSHGGFMVDLNKCVVETTFDHMGNSAIGLQDISNGNIKYIGGYGYETDGSDQPSKYYLNKNDFGENTEVSKQEYETYKSSLNINQYKFVDINTKLNNGNIDKYIK